MSWNLSTRSQVVIKNFKYSVAFVHKHYELLYKFCAVFARKSSNFINIERGGICPLIHKLHCKDGVAFVDEIQNLCKSLAGNWCARNANFMHTFGQRQQTSCKGDNTAGLQLLCKTNYVQRICGIRP